MISSARIPSQKQLIHLLISKGVVEKASKEVKALWNFMRL